MIEIATVSTAEFQSILRDVTEYRTDPNTRHLPLDRLLGWSDSWFYLRQFHTFFVGNKIARSGQFTRPDWSGRAWRILNVAEACGADITISGLEHPKNVAPPVVYVANHMSMLETMLLPGAIILAFHDVTTVVKKSLTTYPVFGKIMRALDPIVVLRENPRDDLRTVLTKGTESLKKGQSVVLFPQSTRTPYFDPADFNSLGVKLARRANVPIIPVALKTDFQGTGLIIKDFGPLDRHQPVRFEFGKPIPTDGNPKDIQDQLLDFITTRLKEWGVEVRE